MTAPKESRIKRIVLWTIAILILLPAAMVVEKLMPFIPAVRRDLIGGLQSSRRQLFHRHRRHGRLVLWGSPSVCLRRRATKVRHARARALGPGNMTRRRLRHERADRNLRAGRQAVPHLRYAPHPWYVRAMWIGFWIGAIWYVVVRDSDGQELLLKAVSHR
jgi:hypothetical protein